MKKLGLALGAGGSRGVAHIGFLKALEEKGVKADFVTGCSMGSVVGCAYSAGISSDDMYAAVRKLRFLDLISPTGGKRGGLFGTKKIRTLLQRYVGDIQFSDLKIPFRCIAVDMISQKLIEFSQGSVLDAVIASSTLPAIFHPFETEDGMRLIDGGLLERVPAVEVKAMGADVVVAVDVLGWQDCSENIPGAIGVLTEVLNMMDNYRAKRRREESADIIDFWLEPALGNMNQFGFKGIDTAYQKGYELGLAHAEKIKESLTD